MQPIGRRCRSTNSGAEKPSVVRWWHGSYGPWIGTGAFGEMQAIAEFNDQREHWHDLGPDQLGARS